MTTATMPALEVEFAYRACEDITRHAAANFYYGIRLLPREKRQAMSAVYAFARRIDDIGDGDGDPAAKLLALDAERALLAAIADGSVLAGDSRPGEQQGDPVAVGLVDALTRFALPLDALELLIDGVELDVRGTRYETFDELVVYCREVAGSIGRLCVAIFTGSDGNGHIGNGHDRNGLNRNGLNRNGLNRNGEDRNGHHANGHHANGHPANVHDAGGHAALADDLGVAMQLTNILRDVREDYENGRVYLPAEDLRRFGCQAPPELSADLIRFEAMRAGEWFDRGLGLVEVLDARSGSCVLAMTGIYRRILDRIEREPEVILQRRISLPAWEKAWLAARSLAGVRT